MDALVTLSLLLAAALLLYFCVLYLFKNGPRLGKAAEATAGQKLKVRLAFGYAALALAAHRAAITYMLLSSDFNKRDEQAFFGMSWWFIDPLAGFPIIIGTLPFVKDMPMQRFIHNYYVPLAVILYGGIIYGLWLLSRRAFAAPKPRAEG
jgi:hypothetical protein